MRRRSLRKKCFLANRFQIRRRPSIERNSAPPAPRFKTRGPPSPRMPFDLMANAEGAQGGNAEKKPKKKIVYGGASGFNQVGVPGGVSVSSTQAPAPATVKPKVITTTRPADPKPKMSVPVEAYPTHEAVETVSSPRLSDNPFKRQDNGFGFTADASPKASGKKSGSGTEEGSKKASASTAKSAGGSMCATMCRCLRK